MVVPVVPLLAACGMVRLSSCVAVDASILPVVFLDWKSVCTLISVLLRTLIVIMCVVILCTRAVEEECFAPRPVSTAVAILRLENVTTIIVNNYYTLFGTIYAETSGF